MYVTSSCSLQECVRGALRNKTILLVTHQVDFLHNVDLILVSVILFSVSISLSNIIGGVGGNDFVLF